VQPSATPAPPGCKGGRSPPIALATPPLSPGGVRHGCTRRRPILQLGRKVKKGEHGIRILAPVIRARRKKEEKAEKDIRTQNQAVLVGFRAAYVFDLSRTEGKELPKFSERVSGNAGEYRGRLVDFAIGQGIELEFKESNAPALGMS
jgi:hypothetical protein